eukprot:403365031
MIEELLTQRMRITQLLKFTEKQISANKKESSLFGMSPKDVYYEDERGMQKVYSLENLAQSSQTTLDKQEEKRLYMPEKQEHFNKSRQQSQIITSFETLSTITNQKEGIPFHQQTSTDIKNSSTNLKFKLNQSLNKFQNKQIIMGDQYMQSARQQNTQEQESFNIKQKKPQLHISISIEPLEKSITNDQKRFSMISRVNNQVQQVIQEIQNSRREYKTKVYTFQNKNVQIKKKNNNSQSLSQIAQSFLTTSQCDNLKQILSKKIKNKQTDVQQLKIYREDQRNFSNTKYIRTCRNNNKQDIPQKFESSKNQSNSELMVQSELSSFKMPYSLPRYQSSTRYQNISSQNKANESQLISSFQNSSTSSIQSDLEQFELNSKKQNHQKYNKQSTQRNIPKVPKVKNQSNLRIHTKVRQNIPPLRIDKFPFNSKQTTNSDQTNLLQSSFSTAHDFTLKSSMQLSNRLQFPKLSPIGAFKNQNNLHFGRTSELINLSNFKQTSKAQSPLLPQQNKIFIDQPASQQSLPQIQTTKTLNLNSRSASYLFCKTKYANHDQDLQKQLKINLPALVKGKRYQDFLPKSEQQTPIAKAETIIETQRLETQQSYLNQGTLNSQRMTLGGRTTTIIKALNLTMLKSRLNSQMAIQSPCSTSKF